MPAKRWAPVPKGLGTFLGQFTFITVGDSNKDLSLNFFEGALKAGFICRIRKLRDLFLVTPFQDVTESWKRAFPMAGIEL